jgi:membrane protease YdiL (CAAX protease family)
MTSFSIHMTKREKFGCAVYLCFSLFLLPSLLAALNQTMHSPWNDAGLNFLFFLLNFLAVVLILRRFLTASGKDGCKKAGKILIAALIGFFVYWVASTLLSRLLLWLRPDFSNVNDSSIAQLTSENFVLMALGTVFLVPVTEECLYRGLLFGALREHSRAAAYLISVPVFCAIHVFRYIGLYSPDLLLLCFLQYVPAGVILAFSYEKADSLFTPILIHTAVNALGMIALR